MTFAASSFAESPFSSQGISDVQIAVTGLSLSLTLGTPSVNAIQNPNVSVTGVFVVENLNCLSKIQTTVATIRRHFFHIS